MSTHASSLRVLVTGGAGFIGTHLVRRLLSEQCIVTVLDNFHGQIHTRPMLPEDIAGRVRLIVASVTNRSAVAESLANQDVVVHLAAETGTGQSMYAIERYERVNGLGTAILLDCLTNEPARTVTKFVVASSRAIYGEGKYRCPQHGTVFPSGRSEAAMLQGQFEPVCPVCSRQCLPLSTDEETPASPSTYYGLTKHMQERAVLMFAGSLALSAFALRYQNVFGPGQSLKNPYTGILAVFSNLARSDQPINVFEDGLETRDFVYVEDVVDATWRCIDPARTGVEVFNVGSGIAITVGQVAARIVEQCASHSPIQVTGAFRKGDIRHNIADLSKVRGALGFEPRWKFEDGLREFLTWALREPLPENQYDGSIEELKNRGLMHG